MADDKKTCFVVMGFGEKTDYKTSRVLDLNKTYRHIIKKAVEDAGLTCIRADEIPHSGTIDAPMYEMLLDADLVIADLSTSNLNAAYELGIRHALKPATTIIIAEDQFDAPFDVNHITIRKFRHDGKSLDIDVVEDFRAKLKQAVVDVLANGRVDSPVYTFLPALQSPSRRAQQAVAAAAADAAPAAPAGQSLAALMDAVRGCKSRLDWATARTLLLSAQVIAPHDVYVTQQLALVTYKGKQPDAVGALHEARRILETLNPTTSNDAETLGLWGAVHKRLHEATGDAAALDTAIAAHEKGWWLLSDYYNGINLAFLLDQRAQRQADRADAVADAVQARRTRRAVSAVCAQRLAGLKDTPENRGERYWVIATQAEAALGDGLPDAEARASALLAQAAPLADADTLLSTTEQLAKLRPLLVQSPLRWVRSD